MALPGFKNTTNIRSIVLDASVRLAFIQLEEKYQTKRLDDLAAISSGGTPSRTDSTLYGGDIPWAKIGDITAAGKWISDTEEYITESAIEQSSAKLFPVGTVFFSMYGSIGKTSIAKRPITTNQAILGLIPSDDISSEFLYYALINARESLFAQSKGTSQKNINGGMVKNFEIPVPPVDEQRKVVEFLSLVEDGEGTGHLVNLPDYLLETRRIVTHIESLAARVNEAQHLREEADKEADILINSYLNKSVSDLGQKYKTVFLEELLTDSNYGTSVKCHPERTNDAIPVLRIPNVASEKVTLNDLKYGVLSEAEFNKTVLSEGDILVVRTNGSKDLVGRCAVVPELPEPMAFASYMIRIRCNKEIILPEFLQLVLRQQRTGGYLIDFARTTAGQYNVSLGRLKNTKIPVPPFDEQRRIVAYLGGLQAKVNALRGLQSKSGEELSALMPSILDKAFKGEL